VTSTDHIDRSPEPRTRARRTTEVGDRAARWRLGGFGPASEEPFRRRPIDWARLVINGGLLAGLTLHAAHPSAIERDVFRLFNALPGTWSSSFRALYTLGTLWAVGLAAAAALIGRRWRLARDLFLAGLAASAIAHALGAWVAGEGLSKTFTAVTRVRGVSPQFPLPRTAVLVAVIATAGPYLTRPTRRMGQAVTAVVAVSALYLGTGLPNDVFGGLFLGLGIAAAMHLAFGSPGGRPTAAQVTTALAELGIDASRVRLARRQPHGSTLMNGMYDSKPISLRVLGRDEADAQFFSTLWRFLAYKDSGPTLYLTRLQQLEHEAYVTLLARDAGVRTSHVIVAGLAGPSAALLVQHPAPGKALAELDGEEVTDELLIDLWRQVGALHTTGRVSHGDLDARHVVVDNGVPGIVDFSNGTLISPNRSNRDVVDLLVSTAVIVGDERSVAAAMEGVGPEALARAIPYMQPAALSLSARSGIGRRRLKAHLDALRTLCAQAAGVEPPQLQELHRVSPTNLLLAVGTLIGIAGLLSQVGSPTQLWDAIKTANWWWVLAAFVLSLATNVPYAVSLLGTVRMKLPLVATTELQLSMSFANLAVPAVGGMASQVRFLQKHGVDLASAVAAGGLLSTVANAVVSLALLAVAVAVSPDRFKTSDIPTAGILRLLLVVVAASGVLAVAIRGIPVLRRAVMPSVTRAWVTVSAALRSPRQVLFLVVGAVGTAVLYALCLGACLKAFDLTLSFWTLLALSIFFGTIAQLIPLPGGGTAVSSVGMSGALIGFGVPTEAAVAAVLLNQVVVNYLPAVPGWFATEHLLHHDSL
jgi:uncharacterized membrane protein YbhN (UPF0104 family)